MAFEAQMMAIRPPGKSSEVGSAKAVHIDDLDAILGEAGLNPELFTDWTFRFGADSLGASPYGEYLLPEFPTLSMLAWVDVDAIIVPTERLSELIDECQRLIEETDSDQILTDCQKIQSVAQYAWEHKYYLRVDGT